MPLRISNHYCPALLDVFVFSQGVLTMVTCSEKDESIYPNMKHCMAAKTWAHIALNTAFLKSNIDGYEKDYEEFKQAVGIKKDKYMFVSFRDYIAAQEVWFL